MPRLPYLSILVLVVLQGCSSLGPPGSPTALPNSPTTAATSYARALVVTEVGAESVPSGSPLELADYDVDPHVEISMSTTQLGVGDYLSVVGLPVDIGAPYYSLFIDHEWILTVSDSGEVVDSSDGIKAAGEQIFDVVSFSAQPWEVEFQLEARRTGIVTIYIAASGEIHYGIPGPTTWGGGSSVAVEVAVSNR